MGMNRYGALAGIIVGGLTVVIWKQLSGGLFDLYEIVPGFLFSLISIIAISLTTAAPNQAILADFDKISNNAPNTSKWTNNIIRIKVNDRRLIHKQIFAINKSDEWEITVLDQ